MRISPLVVQLRRANVKACILNGKYTELEELLDNQKLKGVVTPVELGKKVRLYNSAYIKALCTMFKLDTETSYLLSCLGRKAEIDSTNNYLELHINCRKGEYFRINDLQCKKEIKEVQKKVIPKRGRLVVKVNIQQYVKRVFVLS
jgi:predicted metalloendopeptidase